MAELNFLTPEEIQKLRELLNLPDFDCILRPTWGSQSPGHRDRIHAEINSRLQNGLGIGSHSISHCPTLGGFAITNSGTKLQIGFDVEENFRVRPEIARRICLSEGEFQRAPSPASLWTAKEAAFKALRGPLQPQVVSSIEAASWTILDSQFETASLVLSEIENSSQIQGALFKKNSFTLAFFVLRP